MRLYATVAAEQDLDEIESYIGKDNPAAAISFLNRPTANFHRLVDNPRIGRRRDELQKNRL